MYSAKQRSSLEDANKNVNITFCSCPMKRDVFSCSVTPPHEGFGKSLKKTTGKNFITNE